MPVFWQGFIIGWVGGTFATVVILGFLLVKLLKAADK